MFKKLLDVDVRETISQREVELRSDLDLDLIWITRECFAQTFQSLCLRMQIFQSSGKMFQCIH